MPIGGVERCRREATTPSRGQFVRVVASSNGPGLVDRSLFVHLRPAGRYACPGQGGVLSNGHNDVPEDSPVDLAKRALTSLVKSDATRHSIVIGLVSPLGTPLDAVEKALTESLKRVGYEIEPVHVAGLLDGLPSGVLPLLLPEGVPPVLPTRGDKDYYEGRMNAGDELRRLVGSGSALAARAITRIAEIRESRPEGVAFVLRSLKHVDEHALLRQVYGEAFSLLAVASSADDRREHLIETLAPFEESDARAEAERLITRDEADRDESEFGQQVRKVFDLADAYIPVIRGVDPRSEVDRFVDSLFGQPFLTPRPAEEAMRLAYDASLRSAALGRQVGAALVPPLGAPIVVGTNEVPKPGGGQYWTDDVPDLRDFQSGVDPNPVYMRRAIQELFGRLKSRHWLGDDLKDKSEIELWEIANKQDADGKSLLKDSRVSALIEFNRCVHAEQAAILNAARSGTPTQGATLYTTTFPCHECTKLIIGAGVTEVIYIEPYPKSLASKLFRDIIDTSPRLEHVEWKDGDPVSFRPYQGIAPRRYEMAFRADVRKSGEEALTLDSDAPPHATAWREVAVRDQEDKAIKALDTILRGLTTNVAVTSSVQVATASSGEATVNTDDATEVS